MLTTSANFAMFSAFGGQCGGDQGIWSTAVWVLVCWGPFGVFMLVGCLGWFMLWGFLIWMVLGDDVVRTPLADHRSEQ